MSIKRLCVNKKDVGKLPHGIRIAAEAVSKTFGAAGGKDELIRISVPVDQPVSPGQDFGLSVKTGKCRWYDARDRLIT